MAGWCRRSGRERTAVRRIAGRLRNPQEGETNVILKKIWRAFMAQINKFTNRLRGRDPIAEMQYECDLATEQVKEGRRGLELYRGLVERVSRQVTDGKTHATGLAA